MDKMKAWQFPKPRGGELVSAAYPFEFKTAPAPTPSATPEASTPTPTPPASPEAASEKAPEASPQP